MREWKFTDAADPVARDAMNRIEARDIGNPPRGCLLALAVSCGLWALAILWVLL